MGEGGVRIYGTPGVPNNFHIYRGACDVIAPSCFYFLFFFPLSFLIKENFFRVKGF